LANARKIAEQAKAGTCEYDFVEVMACPGGCIGGAGQPVPKDAQVRMFRTQGLYAADKMLQLHKPQENHFVTELYETKLGEVGGHAAHQLLHTSYQSRRRIADEDLSLTSSGQAKLTVSVCVGTNCIVRGAQDLLHKLVHHVEGQGLAEEVDVRASFCFEQCDRGPTVVIGEQAIHKCTFDQACRALNDALVARSANAT
jgi:NADH-quinone oxidoreductase subunit G